MEIDGTLSGTLTVLLVLDGRIFNFGNLTLDYSRSNDRIPGSGIIQVYLPFPIIEVLNCCIKIFVKS